MKINNVVIDKIKDKDDFFKFMDELNLQGEVFIVKPGDRIPLDGTVVDGHTTVDQSMMTGESIPVHKGYLDDVFTGTIRAGSVGDL